MSELSRETDNGEDVAALKAKVRELEADIQRHMRTIHKRDRAVEMAEARVRELEAENDRLDESFEEAAEERQHAETRAEAAEAKARELEHELDGCSHVQPAECYSRLADAEQKLADANALLEAGLHEPLFKGPLLAIFAAHLTGQPAAPSRTEHNMGEFGYCNTCKAFTCTSRTEAEQAVLDAMAVVGQSTILSFSNSPEREEWHGPAKAELARRGLK